MDFSKYETIAFSRRGKILYVTFNQPDKLNSFSGLAHTELSQVWCDISHDPDSEIVVVTGAGRAFSAGGDIKHMQDLRDNPGVWFEVVREARRIVMDILECDKPIIAKVNGDAIGLGSTITTCCDMVFAAEHARFGDPHNNVALITGDGGQITWPMHIGYAKAKHYLLTGEKLSAQEAERIGLINDFMPAEELDSFVDAYADKLAALPTRSLRLSKATINIPLRQMAASMMDAGMAYEGMAATLSEDHQEAINAFREKRKPEFKGK